MESNLSAFLKIIAGDLPIKIIASNKEKSSPWKKVVCEKIIDQYHISKYSETQVFNENISEKDLTKFVENMLVDFKQINAFCESTEYQLKRSKKDKYFVTKIVKTTKIIPRETQNIQKNRIFPENIVIEPLVDMGVFTRDGKVVRTMYDKYKQINRFIELIDNKVRELDLKSINVIDFGCGKSYLTFIVYYYFRFIRNIKINMIGLDLKQDVIDNCNKSARKYGYETLKFQVGDIKDYKPEFDVDMVITLHACDTATDYALFNAIQWGAKMIFSVPCCQHEINKQSFGDTLPIVSRYGIAKERFSALFTDVIRCNMLKFSGYSVDLIEFIDLDHTPKNLLIRAKRASIPYASKYRMLDETEELMSTFGFSQKLYELIRGKK